PDPPSRRGPTVTVPSAFETPAPLTVGIEEEVMLLDPRTFDLVPAAPQALDRLGGDPRMKAELPLAQLELVTPPAASVGEAVAARPADRALAVYNALRAHLPELAALAANAPFYAGEDTGLASVRPKLCELLPRQGVPPPLTSWAELEDAYRWGEASGAFPPAR